MITSWVPVDGILGGYLGVGFDEYGNFGNNTEGRGAGCNQPDSGFYPNYVTLRGPGNRQTGYCILNRVNVSSLGAVDDPSAKTRTDASRGKATILSLKPSQGNCTIAPSLQCSVGEIASGATVTVVARVRAQVPGMLIDTAAVTGASPDPDTSDDHARAAARILPAPLTITKRASATHIQAGSTVSFAIRVTNQSSTAVHNISVCDRLPTGLVYVSGGALHGTHVCWKIRSLTARHSRSFVVRARAVASHTMVVTNLATVGARGLATRSARATIVIINAAPTFTG